MNTDGRSWLMRRLRECLAKCGYVFLTIEKKDRVLLQIFSGGTDGYCPGRSRAKKQDRKQQGRTQKKRREIYRFFSVWGNMEHDAAAFYTASEALVCLKIAFRHRNISIPPQIFGGRLPAFLHESHPQTNGVPGQRRAAGFCCLFQNIFPRSNKGVAFSFSLIWCWEIWV